jgi:hypothetical protein
MWGTYKHAVCANAFHQSASCMPACMAGAEYLGLCYLSVYWADHSSCLGKQTHYHPSYEGGSFCCAGSSQFAVVQPCLTWAPFSWGLRNFGAQISVSWCHSPWWKPCLPHNCGARRGWPLHLSRSPGQGSNFVPSTRLYQAHRKVLHQEWWSSERYLLPLPKVCHVLVPFWSWQYQNSTLPPLKAEVRWSTIDFIVCTSFNGEGFLCYIWLIIYEWNWNKTSFKFQCISVLLWHMSFMILDRFIMVVILSACYWISVQQDKVQSSMQLHTYCLT